MNLVGVTTVSFSSNVSLVNELKNTGLKFKLNPFGRRLSKEELIDFLKECTLAIIGLDKLDRDTLNKLPQLRVISKYGVGLDNIDLEYCKELGIEVRYPSGINKRSVSELALSMILSLCRNSYVSSLQLKSGKWEKSGGIELTNKTVGIIGFGNIGKDLAMLLQPFQNKIYANDIDPNVFKYKPSNVIKTSFEKILKTCDIISLHLPKTEVTENLINKNSLSMMRDGVIIINTSRGGIVHEQDILENLKSGKIAGYGVDAYSNEPEVNWNLIKLENVFCTPHIGGNSKEAVRSMGLAAIQNLIK